VVFSTAARLRLRAKPHVYACTHLANSASTLLPVSNLTNLLAFGASGLSFLGFTALMAAPWLTSLAVEFLAFRWFFASDLAGSPEPAVAPAVHAAPRFALAVLALTLAGFAASSFTEIPPVAVAGAGAAVLAGKALARGQVGPCRLVREASPLFCLFVAHRGHLAIHCRCCRRYTRGRRRGAAARRRCPG
jgi:arsenical pump membrane protein